MIGVVVWVASALAAPPPSRARTQMLLAVWAAEHGDLDAARTAARAALFHDADAAPPRAFLARLLPEGPSSNAEATALLEVATSNPEAAPTVFTALGRTHAHAGRLAEAYAAFREAEARGAGPDNYAAWVAALALPGGSTHPDAAAVSARWQAVPNPGPGGFALRATLALTPDAPTKWLACLDARAAQRLGEPLAEHVLTDRCVGELAP